MKRLFWFAVLAVIIIMAFVLSSCSAYHQYSKGLFKPDPKDCKLIKCDSNYPYKANKASLKHSMKYYYEKR